MRFAIDPRAPVDMEILGFGNMGGKIPTDVRRRQDTEEAGARKDIVSDVAMNIDPGTEIGKIASDAAIDIRGRIKSGCISIDSALGSDGDAFAAAIKIPGNLTVYLHRLRYSDD